MALRSNFKEESLAFSMASQFEVVVGGGWSETRIFVWQCCYYLVLPHKETSHHGSSSLCGRLLPPKENSNESAEHSTIREYVENTLFAIR
jgi:hypothetical protein